MANLSNINNKFLFTDGDFLLIGGATANSISATESGVAIKNSNAATLSLQNSATNGKNHTLWSNTDGSFNITDVGVATRFTIASGGDVYIPSGNVSIGNTSVYPSGSNTILQIYSVSVPRLKLQNSTTGTAATAGSSFYVTGDDLIINNGETGAIIQFEIGGQPKMRIDGDGNVGIGTTSLQSWARLQVAGTAGAQTGANQALYVTAPSTTAGEGVGIRLSAASGSNEAVGIIGMVNNASGNAGSMTFHTYNGGADIPERMRIDSSGNVGIGTTSPNVAGFPSTTLTIEGSSTNYAAFELGSVSQTTSGGRLGEIRFYNKESSAPYGLASIRGLRGSSAGASELSFWTSSSNSASERMRITSGGDIQVTGGSFYNSSSGITYIGLNSEFEFVDATASTTKRFRPGVDNSFDLGDSSRRWDDVWATNPAIQTSDRNEKNTIKETDLGLDFINKLKPVSYIWNNKTRTHYGLIAQDVQEVLKDISKDTKDFAGFIKADVSEEKDNTKHSYGLRYNEFISPMIKAIQEQQEIINDLKSRIEILENK